MLADLIDRIEETHRHAYNAAFEELGLPWHWDPVTYARLQAHGANGARAYLETEHAHLLRAYDADFLVNAIETAKARCFTGMATARGLHAGRVSHMDDRRARLAA